MKWDGETLDVALVLILFDTANDVDSPWSYCSKTLSAWLNSKMNLHGAVLEVQWDL
jgi:hypothetical protein